MNAHIHNLAEIRRQEVQASLDSKRSSADRNRLGQFATPNSLAIEIASYIGGLLSDNHADIHFADPSVGSGSFFSAALTVFGYKRITRAVGIELDPAFCSAAQKIWSDFGLDTICGDFTQIIASGSVPPGPNLLLANPPYVRHHHLNRTEKERLKRLTHRLTGVEVNGLAGLYVYFLLLATAWMESSGIAAWLIPSEFMDVNYGAALKKFFSDQVTLIRAHRFAPDDVQFDDAFVSSVVLVFRKTAPPSGHAVEFTFGGTIDSPQASESISIEQLRTSRKWSVYPNHDNNDRYTSGDCSEPTLADFFRIQRGIATGCNDFFILDRSEAERRGLPTKYLRPILPSPRNLKTVVIDADKAGYPLVSNQLCVIDCDLREAEIESRFPRLWEYLQTADALGVRSGYLVNKRTPWYKQERREPASFLCTYMGRGAKEKQPFRFIWNRSNAIGTNLYLMLYARGALSAMLKRCPERGGDVRDILGNVSGYELRGEGRVYGGGLHKIEPSELGRISASPLIARWPELSASVQHLKSKRLFV